MNEEQKPIIKLIRGGFEFSASHNLPKKFGCKENTLHSHKYALEVVAMGLVEEGMAMNTEHIKEIVTEVISALDKKNLNNYFEIPSMENIAIWIYNQIKLKMPLLNEITLHETPKNSVTYNGN